MTGYESKRAAARDKLAHPVQEPVAWMYQEYRDGWRDEIQFVQPPNDPIYFRNIVPVYDTPPPQRTVQVSPLEFVEMVMDKEHLVGNPIVWAQWPNKENT